jgi:hypothetical protein
MTSVKRIIWITIFSEYFLPITLTLFTILELDILFKKSNSSFTRTNIIFWLARLDLINFIYLNFPKFTEKEIFNNNENVSPSPLLELCECDSLIELFSIVASRVKTQKVGVLHNRNSDTRFS